MKKPAILLSGGMDSSTALAYALQDAEPADAVAIFVDYGQRHVVERESARAVAGRYGVILKELDLTSFGKSVQSALTSDIEVPHGHYAEDNMILTVVPNRNATMLSAAAGIAASRGCDSLYTAIHAGDHAVYADCRPDFIQALSAATVLACGVEIVAPFVEISKADIAKIGDGLGVPYDLTWSCYEGDGEKGHCGRCGTCVERAASFDEAGIPDPTRYADSGYWRQAIADYAAKNG